MIQRKFVLNAALVVALCGAAAFAQEAEDGRPAVTTDFSDHQIAVIDVDTVELLAELESSAILLACRTGLGVQHVVLPGELAAELRGRGVVVNTIEPDAQAWMNRDRAERDAKRAQRGVGFFDIYRRYGEISTFLDGVVADHPGIAVREVVGTSFGDDPLGLPGLEIFSIRLTGPGLDSDPMRPVVVINGCQHAREWISPASVTYVINELADMYGNDPRVTEIINEVELHFIPVMNPNGYEYTHTNNRFWRKNRRSNAVGGVGVDPNRNWPVGWNNGISTSTSGNNDLYVGTAPLSEPETNSVAVYMENLAGSVVCLDGCGNGCCGIGESTSRLKGHLDVHSFSQVILGPWSFTDQVAPPRVEELTLVQDNMSAAMFDATGFSYPAALGDSPLLPPAGGVMPDWSFGELGALSWTLEMRPQSNAGGGFELPESQIIPASEELLAAVIELADHARKRLEISTPAPLAETVQAEAPLALRAEVLELNGNKVVTNSVVARTRAGGAGPFDVVPMSPESGGFAATIMTPPCDTLLEIYYEAQAFDGTVVRFPADAPTSVFTTTTAELTVVADDDFESDNGWTRDPEGNDTAIRGLWERAAPGATSAQSSADFSADGTLCWVTDGNPGASLGSGDVDGGVTTLVSPAFDLSGADAAVVRYTRWYSNTTGNSPNADVFVIEVSNDDGINWVELETVGPGGPDTSGGWRSVSFRVEDFVSLTGAVRFRFSASDLGGGSIVEAAIDEFGIETIGVCETVSGCTADLDSNSAVNLDDFSIFIAQFGNGPTECAGGCTADLDGNDRVDLDDFSIFIAQFGNGPTECGL